MHFFAVRVTRSLSRLAAQMERVAAFDFADDDAGAAGPAASRGSEDMGSAAAAAAAGGGHRWVQATSLLTEVRAGREGGGGGGDGKGQREGGGGREWQMEGGIEGLCEGRRQ